MQGLVVVVGAKQRPNVVVQFLLLPAMLGNATAF